MRALRTNYYYFYQPLTFTFPASLSPRYPFFFDLVLFTP